MKIRKAVACLVAAIMALGMLACLEGFAQEAPRYRISAQVEEDGSVDVSIAVQGTTVLAGRAAIGYDASVLELKTSSGDALKAGEDINQVVETSGIKLLVEDGVKKEQLVDIQAGRVLFAWAASAGRLDCGEPVVIARLRFGLREGKSREDFNGATFRPELEGLPETPSWDTPFELIVPFEEYYVKNYKYNADGYEQCGLTFDYPGVEVEPEGAARLRLSVTDTDQKPLSAVIAISGKQYDTDAAGKAEIPLADGTYAVGVSAAGYESKSEPVSMAGEDVEKTISLRSIPQVLEAAADALEIGYAAGDSAQRVTKILTLPVVLEPSVTVSWASSNPAVISNIGTVTRPVRDTEVVLRATLTKEGMSVEKQFPQRVAGTGGGSSGGPSGPSVPGSTSKPEASPSPDPQAEPSPSPVSSPAPENPEDSRFEDLGGVPWAREAIVALAREGIIKGTGDTTFSPQTSISRGDYLTLLVRMLGLTGEAGDNFSDVAEDSYYYEEIGLAKQYGMTQGIGNNCFAPGEPITRQDMMTLSVNALLALDKLSPGGALSLLEGFTDGQEIADYARQSAACLVENGYITGDESGRIAPRAHTTRAETAVFLYRLYLSQIVEK